MFHRPIDFIVTTLTFLVLLVPTDARGEDDLFRAIRVGDLPRIRALIDAATARVNEHNALGQTPLHAAALVRNAAVCDWLLQHGADPSLKDRDGLTPLLVVATLRSADVAESLLRHGADPNAMDARGQTALHLAVSPDPPGASPEATPHIVKLLLTRRANANAAAIDGTRPLHLAAMTGRADVVTLLIEAGGEPNARDTRGRRAVHLASMGNHVKVLVQLWRAKADLAAADAHGETALHTASRRARIEATTWLLDHGLNVNVLNAARQTPMHVLADQGPNAAEWDAALAAAAELLLRRGADPTRRDANGLTPLDYAQRHGHTKLIAVLTRKGGAS